MDLGAAEPCKPNRSELKLLFVLRWGRRRELSAINERDSTYAPTPLSRHCFADRATSRYCLLRSILLEISSYHGFSKEPKGVGGGFIPPTQVECILSFKGATDPKARGVADSDHGRNDGRGGLETPPNREFFDGNGKEARTAKSAMPFRASPLCLTTRLEDWCNENGSAMREFWERTVLSPEAETPKVPEDRQGCHALSPQGETPTALIFHFRCLELDAYPFVVPLAVGTPHKRQHPASPQLMCFRGLPSESATPLVHPQQSQAIPELGTIPEQAMSTSNLNPRE
ncbi:hypothetical protein FA13DRAFT_1774186 [Coprinellus micaceus]|uniref:Uncharacterized protein n=1 Tax=Coprinellus micaceus TaxID=71717 RepID=A0A4Y7TDG3_COPMI|nr:hypothetical protein FA13DRAFT_1774186 [Coprinellus micaceus]